jgi:hypothetical protein
MEFLSFLIRGIPVIGKVVDAFTTYTNKKMDTEVQKYTTDGKIDVDVVQARTQLAIAMKDDPATKFGRWFFIIPTGLFYTPLPYGIALGILLGFLQARVY